MKQAYQRPQIDDLGTLADITLGSGLELSDIQGAGIQGIGGSVTVPTAIPTALPQFP